jgi:phosphoribosylformylglycinamidine (FGAM) synthase PurS component
MFIFVDDAVEAVTSTDVQACNRGQIGDRCRQRLQRSGVRDPDGATTGRAGEGRHGYRNTMVGGDSAGALAVEVRLVVGVEDPDGRAVHAARRDNPFGGGRLILRCRRVGSDDARCVPSVHAKANCHNRFPVQGTGWAAG